MKYEKRSNKDGTTYYSFVHYDSSTDKRLRLTREEIRKRFGKDILTEAEATECLKLLEAQFESEKIRIQRRLAWETEFYNFVSILEMYEKTQKKRAPNSWQNNVFYIKHYARTIPIVDKTLWNELVELAAVQYDLWKAVKNQSKKDFLLFQGLDDSTASSPPGRVVADDTRTFRPKVIP